MNLVGTYFFSGDGDGVWVKKAGLHETLFALGYIFFCEFFSFFDVVFLEYGLDDLGVKFPSGVCGYVFDCGWVFFLDLTLEVYLVVLDSLYVDFDCGVWFCFFLVVLL